MTELTEQEQQQLRADGYLNHSSNGALTAEAAKALGLDDEAESKKAKKKKKKKQKKAEERERRQTLERMDAAHPRLDGAPLKETEKATEDVKAPSAPRMQAWLRQVSGTLDTHRLLTSQKASVLIGINGVMLAIAAHSLYRGLAPGPLQWALIPLALTNLLSLAFAVFSAQIRKNNTTLDELWSMPADEYLPAVTAMLHNKQRVYESLSGDLHLLGVDLHLRQKHLRTAYNVLLGGAGLSALLFVICAAMAAGNP